MSQEGDLTPILRFLVQPEEWQDDAACRGKPLEWFFPERGHQTSQAKSVCAECEVTQECAAYQEKTNSTGVWNGRIHGSKASQPVREIPAPVQRIPDTIPVVRRTGASGASEVG